ncbi:MAG: hypothetical protein ACMUIL_13875 [bacterium]
MSRIARAVGWVFFLSIMVCLFAGHAGASNHDRRHAQSSTWDARISELNRALKERRSERVQLSRKADRLAEGIRQERQKSGDTGSRRLDSMLRESQQLVSDLESVSRQVEEIEGKLAQEYSTAIAALVHQVEGESGEKKKKGLLNRLIDYIEQYEGLMKPAPMQIPEVSVEIRESDTPSEIRRKADFLADQTALMKAKMLQIDAQINKLEKEKALRDKVRGFADEIDFFDSTLFVEARRGAQAGPDTVIPDGGEGGEPDEGDDGPMLGDVFDQAAVPSINVHDAPESLPSDLVLSTGIIDNRIEQLRRQRLRLDDLSRQLREKMQIFYNRAEEAGSSGSQ